MEAPVAVRLQIALLVTAILAVPAVEAIGIADIEADTEVRPEPTGSIIIQGDDELTDHPAVREGSGTAEDPYVISDWVILRTEGAGIRLEDTSRHVLVENVIVLEPINVGASGVELSNASNVTIQDAWIQGATIGVKMFYSSNVTLERVLLEPDNEGEAPIGGFQFGMDLLENRNVRLGNVSIDRAEYPAWLVNTRNMTISDSTFGTDDVLRFWRQIPFSNMTDASIERSVFDNVGLIPQNEADNVTLAYNVFEEGDWNILGARDAPQIVEGELCGNEFRRGDSGVDLDEAGELEIRGNVFANATFWNLDLWPESLEFTHNRVLGSEDGARIRTEAAQVYNNSIHGNDRSLFSHDTDARWNWWGDASGPNLTDYGDEYRGPGDGENVWTAGNEVRIDSWLTEPPATGPDAVDCGVPDGEAGVKEDPRLSAELRAMAEAAAQLEPSAGPIEIDPVQHRAEVRGEVAVPAPAGVPWNPVKEPLAHPHPFR
ncbi:hypothetical protein BRD56_03900 [Thermoplasmatales archaeon SW_10_69_26]|nr:MAG: hypothetical protein BRD56_03900 [Thermoplasmatales archaeon SW_10_69_26]